MITINPTVLESCLFLANYTLWKMVFFNQTQRFGTFHLQSSVLSAFEDGQALVKLKQRFSEKMNTKIFLFKQFIGVTLK